MAAKVSRNTFKSITDPISVPHLDLVIDTLASAFKMLVYRYVPGITKIPFNQGFSFMPTWKSVPGTSFVKASLKRKAVSEKRSLWSSSQKSIFTAFHYEVSRFLSQYHKISLIPVDLGLLWLASMIFLFIMGLFL